MSIRIKKIVGGKKDLRAFIHFYNKLYGSNPQVAFPLEFDELSTLTKGKNPAHDICESSYWLAYRNNKVVGRIAAIINPIEQEKSTESIGRFGFFDFENDHEVSKVLMHTALNWLKRKGVKTVHGPLGFTDLDRQGMLIYGFDREGTMATNYNHEYYIDHIEKLGFKKSVDWIEYRFEIESDVPEKIQKISRFAQKRYGVKPLKAKSKKELKRYVPDMFNLINDSYKDIYGYTNLTKEQIDYYGKNYIGFVKKELVSLVLDKENKLVGIGITMPSFTKALQKARGRLLPFGWYHMLRSLNKNDTMDMYLIAVDTNYFDKGVAAVIIDEIYRSAIDFGIKKVETNIELEDNHRVQSMWKYFNAEQHKRRRCYIKNI
ncbi:GTP cyclohydrolase [Maribacter sp. X9]|uniref:GTP cyclohydrolase n=1 Tax=Maribacter sp. X9 TaxID=3402159 RepID=UPI003AF3B2A3